MIRTGCAASKRAESSLGQQRASSFSLKQSDHIHIIMYVTEQFHLNVEMMHMMCLRYVYDAV